MARSKELAASTWGIPPKVRRTIRSFVLGMRRALEEDFARQLAALGITPEATSEVSGGRELSERDQRVREAAIAVIERLNSAKASHEEAFEAFVRDSTFTFLNRMVGLRCLEERGMLIVEGRQETAIRQDPNLRASSLYFRVKSEFPDDTSPREVWVETLGRATRAVSERIGAFFDPDSEYGRLFPLQPALTRLIEGLNEETVPPEVYAEDELLGWVYQYYNAEEKDEVYDKLGKGGKIERPEELAAASCLYTERYMVDFLLQNTLGTLWTRMHPETNLPKGWPYYVRPPEGQPEPTEESLPERVRDITLLDPAVGSGHFLVRAFDLLARMYKEEGIESEEEVPQLILERNLHGIDIDLRAAQISALALYLKGCDLAGPDFRPTRINLVSADVILPGAPPASLLERYAGEPDIQQLMKTVWTELKDVPVLGSLLHPERKIDELLEKRRRGGDTLLQQDVAAWERFKIELLEGLREEYEKEAQSEDIGQRLFGENLAKSISLVEALSRHYDVVVANPPYAGSKNLDEVVRRHIEREYKEGKRDLYAAFILRCMEFARIGACVGMVAQQSWMFLRSFAKLREKLLAEAAINSISHLGPRAFEEIGGEVVNVGLFTLRTGASHPEHRWTAFRLIGPRSPIEKNRLLLDGIADRAPGVKHAPKQRDIFAIPETPFVYWLRPRFFELLQSARRLSDVGEVRQGLATADNERFLRFFWEVTDLGVVKDGKPVSGRWFQYAKGGRYQKWAGVERLVINWAQKGRELKAFPPSVIRNENYYFRPGLTYTQMSSGSMGTRLMLDSLFDVKGMSVFSEKLDLPVLAAFLSSRPSSYLLRVTTQNLEFHAGYVSNLPLPKLQRDALGTLGTICIDLKRELVAREVEERLFGDLVPPVSGLPSPRSFQAGIEETWSAIALLHSLEGVNERLVCDAYELDDEDIRAIVDETGLPAGWYPLISGYDKVPQPPEGTAMPSALTAFFDVHERADLSADDLAKLKDRLRAQYKAGPGSRVEEEKPMGDEEVLLGARILIPTETFIEELSVKLGIHPISIYNLLEEMREAEGLVSPPIMKALMEDDTSVTMLRLLGYRWPEQDSYESQHGSILPPDLVDPDGIIPLLKCNNELTAAERIRARLEHQFGEDGAARSEEEFRTWTGKKLETWLEKEFFKRHVTQFKRRPIAWHLTSPEGAFQAFVLHHKLSKATLERLKNLYAAALIRRLKGELERAQGRADSGAVRELALQIEDVQEFIDRLKAIEEGRTLDARIRCRWKNEEEKGRPGPYAPDIDDGVKVNIRPFQEMGLLSRKVISKW